MPRSRQLGRKHRGFDSRIACYSIALRRGRLMQPLVDTDYGGVLPADTGMMLNDRLGCCPIAGAHHGRQLWTAVAGGQMITDPDADVLADYESMCGYVEGDPCSDNGGVLQDVLTKAVRDGLTTSNGKDKLLGFYEIDPRNLVDVARAIVECGFAYIGIDIPQAWTEAQAGDTWDATDSPVAGGHCVILVGFKLDENGHPATFAVLSWGMRFKMTAAGFRQSCDEVYGLIDRDWVKATGKTPAGLTLDQVAEDMRAIAA